MKKNTFMLLALIIAAQNTAKDTQTTPTRIKKDLPSIQEVAIALGKSPEAPYLAAAGLVLWGQHAARAKMAKFKLQILGLGCLVTAGAVLFYKIAEEVAQHEKENQKQKNQ